MRSRTRTLLAAAVIASSAARARAGAITGRLLDRGGNPVAGARVTWTAYRAEEDALADATEGVEPKELGQTQSAADGRFRVALADSAPAVSITIRAAAHPDGFLPGPYDASDTIDLADIALPAGAPASGKVVDVAGKPIANARLRLRSLNFADDEVVFLAEARSGADGAFSMTNAPEGFRSVGARAAGFVPVDRPAAGSDAPDRIAMKTGGAIAGTVVDASGSPAAGAVVVSDQTAARTDANGRFRLAAVAAGKRSVETLWKADFVARKDGVAVSAGADAVVSLRLERAAAIAGSVIDETTRKPIGGARIAVADPGIRFNRAPVRRSVRTDSRGKFAAGGLEAGRYAVEAARGGYVPTSIPNVTATVAAGGGLAIALAPASSIAGRVLDDKKQPVRGAEVRITRDAGGRGFGRRGGGGGGGFPFGPERTAVTGPDGVYRMTSLSAGRGVTVEAAKAGFAPIRRTGLSLKAGEHVQNVDLTLKTGLTGSGKIVDAKGQPVANAEIRSQRRAGRGGGAARLIAVLGQSGRTPDAVSATDGTFSLSGLEEGDYELSVSRPGYAAKETNVAVKGPEASRWSPIVLTAGVGIGGTVKDPQGTPVAGATVFLVGDAGRTQSTVTGSDGVFRLGDLPAGRAVMLAINADGYAPARSGATPPAENVAVVLQTSGTIRGRVVDGDGNPISEFTVSLTAAAGGGFGGFARGAGGGPGPQNVRASDGSFELDNVSPGTWTVRASSPTYRTADVSGISIGPGEVRDGVVVPLKKGGVVVGRTLDASTGAPVPNVIVSWEPQGTAPGPAAVAARLLGGGGANVTATDADGRFGFDSLPDGRVTLTTTHPDYLSATRDADPSNSSELAIPLGTGGTITGAVVTADGSTPVPGAMVRLDDEGDAGQGPASQTAPADGSGAFEFVHLGAGRFRLTAQSDRGTSAPKDVILADNQRQDGVVLTVSTGTILDGTVTGLPAGQLAGVRVTSSGPGYRDSAMTDDAGRFTLREVPSGVVTVTASTSFLQRRTTSKTVEIADGTEELPVEIAFQGTSSLAGRVTRGGSGMPGLMVFALPDPPDGSGRVSGQTDGSGHYELDGLEDGNYQVSVNGPGVTYRKSFAVSGESNGDIQVPGTSLSGVVTDSSTGEALSGATVQAETGQETQSQSVKRAVTDSGGSYQIVDFDPGNYQVTARQTGYQLKTQTVSVGSDPAQLDFQLDKGSGAQIRVLDGQTGMPLGGVNALAFAGDGTVAFQGSVGLDATGLGEIPSLAAGRYAVYVFSSGYAPRSIQAMDVPAPAPVPFMMTPGGSVETRAATAVGGRIVDGSGAPYLLNAFRLDGAVSAVPPVTVWQHLAPGNYTLLVATGNGDQPYPFTVAEGQTTEVVVK